jgi:hypothetical protein
MADDYRYVEVSEIRKIAGNMPPAHFGDKPQLRWIAVECLRIDPAYQRTIMQRGSANVIKIARDFSWIKFGVITVAETDTGIFLIIDGQHRTAAAMLRRIKDVPCKVVRATRAQQAGAFAAINSQVTAVSAQQIFVARLAEGDTQAIELQKVCAEAGVTICPYPVPANKMKVGETLAVGALAVRALCSTLAIEPEWQDGPRLIKIMQSFDFANAWTAAAQASIVERCSVESKLVDLIADHIERGMTQPVKRVAK